MTIHQVACIGDVHARAGHSRNAARLKALDAIIAEGLALPNLSCWIQLGDLFDGKSSVQDRNDIAPRLQVMAEKAPVVILGGNHEAPGDTEILGRLEARYPIGVATSPQVVRAYTGGVAIAAMPYPSRGGLIAGGTTAADTLQTGQRYLEDILRGFGSELLERVQVGRPTLFVGHLNIAGAVYSSGQTSIGHELELDPSALRLLGDMPKVLGHVHAPQEIGGAYYAGSITANSWGEREAKRWILVEFEEGRDYRIISRPIDTPPMVHVEGRLTREGFTLNPGDYPASWDGIETRVRYSFLASERDVLDHSLVRAPFAGALRLEVEPIAVPDRALRAPEVAAARTLADKVQAWAHLSGATVTESVLAKLAALEHQDAAQALSTVATQIAALEHAEKSEAAA